jgi:serine protease Do
MDIFTTLFSHEGSGKSRIKHLLTALLAVLSAAVACNAQGPGLSPDARRDSEARPGVVVVTIEMKGASMGFNCETGASGSGFLYRPDGYLITNGHVAQLANKKDDAALRAQKLFIFSSCLKDTVEQKIHRNLTTDEAVQLLQGMRVASALSVVLDNHTQLEGEIKAYSDPITSGGKDVAIIKIDGNNLPTVPLGDSSKVNVNDHVYVIGYPGSARISNASVLVATSSDGIISALKVMDYSASPLIQTNANINHGNSGGPAFDNNGQVIGIATMGKEAPGFNFLVPISTAMEFVRQAGAEPQRGTFDKRWHDALDAYENQDWEQAHNLLNQVLEMMPNQPEAMKLRDQAADNLSKETPFNVSGHL